MPDGFVPTEDPLDVLVVIPGTGRVHRWACDRIGSRTTRGWSPAMAGLDDQACPECLPNGLPTHR